MILIVDLLKGVNCGGAEQCATLSCSNRLARPARETERAGLLCTTVLRLKSIRSIQSAHSVYNIRPDLVYPSICGELVSIGRIRERNDTVG